MTQALALTKMQAKLAQAYKENGHIQGYKAEIVGNRIEERIGAVRI